MVRDATSPIGFKIRIQSVAKHKSYVITHVVNFLCYSYSILVLVILLYSPFHDTKSCVFDRPFT